MDESGKSAAERIVDDVFAEFFPLFGRLDVKIEMTDEPEKMGLYADRVQVTSPKSLSVCRRIAFIEYPDEEL